MKKTRIDRLGRFVIPISYRKLLNITPETDLIIECDESKITITSSTTSCKLCGRKIEFDKPFPLCKECIQKIKVDI